MKLRLGEKEIKVYFLNERHLDLLNSKKLTVDDLPFLPKFKEVTDEDCLDWISFQRGVEKQYCGFKSTTYTPDGDITIAPFNRDGVVYKAKYDEVLNGDAGIKLGRYFYFHSFNGKMFILNSNNTVKNAFFNSLPSNLPGAVYQALLSSFSMFETYFRENSNLKDTVSQRKYIDTGYVISKVVG